MARSACRPRWRRRSSSLFTAAGQNRPTTDRRSHVVGFDSSDPYATFSEIVSRLQARTAIPIDLASLAFRAKRDGCMLRRRFTDAYDFNMTASVLTIRAGADRQKIASPARCTNASNAAMPASELPLEFNAGDQTAIARRCGTTATIPPPTPLLVGNPTRQATSPASS